MNEFLSFINLDNFNEKEIMFLVYLSIVNLVAFAMMGIDKSKAQKKQYRISENALMGAAVVGGSVGSLIGMTIFKHKTSKKMFYIGIPVIYLINQIVIILVFNSIK